MLDAIVQQSNAAARQESSGTKRKLELALASPAVPSPAPPATVEEDTGFKFTRTPGRNAKRTRRTKTPKLKTPRVKTPLQPSASQNDGAAGSNNEASGTPKVARDGCGVTKRVHMAEPASSTAKSPAAGSRLKKPAFKKNTRTRTQATVQ